ncbi:MAG: hypothetical protein HY906_11845 [Deltaproteobacteria bacterium]|nr:hypothetical protein [Deltaproteobacteria bacterium]
MRRVFLWAVLLGIGLPAMACGGSAANGGKDAATDSGPPHDVGPPDGVLPDTGDGATDGPAGDGGGDGATDTLPGDAGGDAGVIHAKPFTSETAGGATVSSANYRVTLFIAPAVPVGSTQSTNYRVGLGPGAIANAR